MSLRARRAAASLIFVALNLRLAVAAVPPVLGEIERDTGLSPAAAGVLTAVPVFCFGAIALATPPLIRRLRMSPLLLLTMVVVAAGCAIRLAPSLVALFAGTVVLGGGIAVANALVPGLIKRDFPAQAAVMVGLYSVTLSLSGAISSGLTVPIEHLVGIGWRPAIAVWGIGAVVAALLWAPQARRPEPTGADPAEAGVGRALWRDRLAWNVTFFWAMQSFGFYSILSWLPTILEDHGIARGTAGGILSLSFFPGMAAAFATPVIQRRLRRKWMLVAALVVLWSIAFVGLIVAPAGGAYAWAVLLGLGQGTGLSLGLGFIVARAPDTRHAAHLSTMAQGVGYLIASAGPFLLGALHDLTGGWTAPLLLLVATMIPTMVVGVAAGRDRHVLEGEPSEPCRGAED